MSVTLMFPQTNHARSPVNDRASRMCGLGRLSPVHDAVFLAAFAAALVIGAQVYAATGWPIPGLIDKGD